MIKQVWKFRVQLDDHIANDVVGSIVMPRGTQILAAASQDEWLCLWGLVDVGRELETRRFVIYGTGHDIVRPNLKHVSTFQVRSLVFHVFEVLP